MSKLIINPDEIKELYEFIKQKPLDYPDYLTWVEKCYRELQSGYKKGFVSGIDGKIIADFVVQQHKQEPDCLEIKNAQVAGGFEGRGIFTAIYSEIEKYARENKFKRIVCDAHATNNAIIAGFLKLGFRVVAHEKLYNSGLEAIMEKELG
ncbi:MAG: GNAT family N-acetyltransferase [Nanoarchaeota archaeon]